jgi:hypothetical protein
MGYIDVFIPAAGAIYCLFASRAPRSGEAREDFLARQQSLRRTGGVLLIVTVIYGLIRLSQS